MAAEKLILKMPGAAGEELDLSDGNWDMEALELGNPPDRDEWVSGVDSHGSRPGRVPLKDNRTVTGRIRMVRQVTRDAVTAELGKIDRFLEKAKKIASQGAIDPTDYVRAIYTPQGSSISGFMPVYGANIPAIARVLSGEDIGWFLRVPVLQFELTCDPFIFGAKRTYYEGTTSADLIAPTLTVNGGPGDVPPWLRTTWDETANRLRGRLSVGVKQDESGVNGAILATAMTTTGYSGSIGSGFLINTSPDWSVAAAIPRQSRPGPFKVYLTTAFSLSEGKVRLHWAEAGGSREVCREVDVTGAGVADIFLGEVNPGSSWDAWIETKGDVRCWAGLIMPADSTIDVVGGLAGKQLAGELKVSDDLSTTSAHIASRAMATGGAWSTAGTVPTNTWPVSGTGASRTAVSMAAPGFAIAGTTNHIDVEVKARISATSPSNFTIFDWSKPVHGIFARYVNTTNFIVAGWAINGELLARPGLWQCVGGAYKPLWLGPSIGAMSAWLSLFGFFEWTLQVTSDGRWYVGVELKANPSGDSVLWSANASGAEGVLIAGETLGAPANAKVGIFDNYPYASPSVTRRASQFRTRSLVGVTPPPIPAGEELSLAGAVLLTENGAEYPYQGSSGIELAPGVNNNLTFFTRRSAGRHKDSGTGNTDSIMVRIEGHPRFLTVPHA